MSKMRRALAVASMLAVASCVNAAPNNAIPTMTRDNVSIVGDATPPTGSGKIKHVVVVVQENRSFDNLFATFPGADGATKGLSEHHHGYVALRESNLVTKQDLGHGHKIFELEFDHGKMDGFDNIGQSTFPYAHVKPAEIAPYWKLAHEYVLADRMFETQTSDSFTAHQDLIRGNSLIDVNQSLVNVPSNHPWGCDAPKGTWTSLINDHRQMLYGKGPFPCLTYKTLRDLLDAKRISWKYYVNQGTGSIWNAFDAIRAVRYGVQWKTNVSMPETNFFGDVSNGRLPSVSWVIPNWLNSDHPSASSDTGPSWVAQIVNAIGKSPYWNDTAIVIVWDDWGGWYDHVPPPQLDFAGLGFRVPALIVSAYAKKGYVSHTQYEFGSVVRFIENLWYLGRLNTTDVRANSIQDAFDFTKPPRGFTPLEAKYSTEYFLHQPVSNRRFSDDDAQ